VNFGGGSERRYIEDGGAQEHNIFGLEVPGQCPLVLVGVNHIIRSNSEFNFYGVRGAAFERNLIRY
jgi:hypothetical protein